MTQSLTRPRATVAPRARSRKLPPRWRKVALTVHVAVSVGWLGAAFMMVVLGVTALRTGDPAVRHAAYLAGHLGDRAVMIPFSLLALLSGLLSSLGTPWGLIKHYWVMTKLVLTVAVMVFAAFYLSQWAEQAGAAPVGTAPGVLGRQVVIGAAATFSVLLLNTTLSVFKPWGRTRRGAGRGRR